MQLLGKITIIKLPIFAKHNISQHLLTQASYTRKDQPTIDSLLTSCFISSPFPPLIADKHIKVSENEASVMA